MAVRSAGTGTGWANGTAAAGSDYVAQTGNLADYLDLPDLAQEGAGHRGERDPGRGLASAGAFKNGTGIGEAVLLHAGEVGVTGTRSRERRIACQ